MFEFKNDNRGLVQWIFLIIIAVIILSYLGVDLRSIIEAEQTQNNLDYLWGGVTLVWDNYLATPILYFWQNIFIDLVWSTFTDNLDKIQEEGFSPSNINLTSSPN